MPLALSRYTRKAQLSRTVVDEISKSLSSLMAHLLNYFWVDTGSPLCLPATTPADRTNAAPPDILPGKFPIAEVSKNRLPEIAAHPTGRYSSVNRIVFLIRSSAPCPTHGASREWFYPPGQGAAKSCAQAASQACGTNPKIPHRSAATPPHRAGNPRPLFAPTQPNP